MVAGIRRPWRGRSQPHPARISPTPSAASNGLGVEGKRQLLMSVVNWGEVYYSIWRAKGPSVARKILEDISQLPLEIVDADLDLTRRAAELRAEHKLPYADCCAAALASDRKASLATSDNLSRSRRGDFAHVEKKMDILWTL
jgi:predicted nucleic acid-binding protein